MDHRFFFNSPFPFLPQHLLPHFLLQIFLHKIHATSLLTSSLPFLFSPILCPKTKGESTMQKRRSRWKEGKTANGHTSAMLTHNLWQKELHFSTSFQSQSRAHLWPRLKGSSCHQRKIKESSTACESN